MNLPLVLLHGWGMTPKVWNGLRICLSPRLAQTPALPGHGEMPSPAASLTAWSDAIAAELPARCVLTGWSLGALIALDIAHRYPERIASLVLFGATPCFVSRQETLRRPGWAHGLGAATVKSFCADFATDPDATRRRFMALQAMGESQRRGVVHSLQRAIVPLDDSQGLADGLTILAETDLREKVADIGPPVTLIHGREDALMPLAAAEWLAEHLPTAHLTVLDGCGHAPFVSRPEACAAQLIHAIEHAR